MKSEAFYQYLQARKQKPKTNYYLASLKELDEVKQLYPNQKPKLLLHACCAVCAGWPLEFLTAHFDVDIYYANSNIWPRAEYEHRLEELRRLLQECYGDRVKLFVPDYDNAAYTLDVLEEYKDDPEGFRRCFGCYTNRIEESFRFAVANHYDYITTVMTVSRQKDSQKLNEIGIALNKKYPEIHYFTSDFKKANGQVCRDELASKHNLYRQDYCGCVYSWEERFLTKTGCDHD